MIRRVIAVTTAALMLVVLLVRHYPEKILTSARADAAVLRGHIDRDQYLDQFGGFGNRRGYSARANADLADYVRGHTSPDDRIFLFGINGAGVYFAADRLPAHRFLREGIEGLPLVHRRVDGQDALLIEDIQDLRRILREKEK